jgi:hypothetical protein
MALPRYHRLLRAVVASAVALAVWVLARPALAAPAPFCDDRGASALASAPPLQEPPVVLGKAPSGLSCPSADLPLGSTLSRGHRAVSSAPQLSEPFLPLVSVRIPPAEEVAAGPTVASINAPVGVRSRVERPPRG